jgi:hypothetical protein
MTRVHKFSRACADGVSTDDRTPDSRHRHALFRQRSHSVVSIDTSGTRLDEGAFIRHSRQPEEGPFSVDGRWVSTADLRHQLVAVQLAADPLLLRRMGEVRGSTVLKGGRRPGLVDNVLAVAALIVAELRIPARRAHRLRPPMVRRPNDHDLRGDIVDHAG